MAMRLTPDQRRIVETLDRPLFVAAGAGSGKSSTLAERVAWALTPGSAGPGRAYVESLDQVLVITFTRLAAAEITEKIRERLREAGMVDAALAVDAAWISTIHSMCARILRRHAFDLGLDPRFSVLSEAASARLVEQATDECLRAVTDRGAYPDLLSAFPARSRGAGDATGSVFGMARALRAAAGSAVAGFDSLSFPGEPSNLPGLAARLADEAERALVLGDDASAFRSATGASQRSVIERVLERAGELSMRPPARLASELADELACLERPKCTYGPKDFKAVVRELQAAFDEVRLAADLTAVAPLSRDLLAIAREVDERYAELKAAEGALDNDDLLARTLAAFRERPEIAASFGQRFRLVMVDEFQDTNAQQVRMIELLSGAGARHLTTVGDAQQSIYRFRAADVQVFRDREAALGEASKACLTTNFRSHADVLALVERALAAGPLPDFMPLEACPTRPDGLAARALPRVDIELVSSVSAGRRRVPARTRVEATAALVADRVRERIAAGERPGDVALLLGRMSNLDVYLEALRSRGIDCVVSGGSTFSQASEVRLVAALARALANPKDTQSGLFPVLVSELFALEAADLALLATKVQEANGAFARRGIDVGLLSGELPAAAGPRLSRAQSVLARGLSRVGSWRAEDVLAAVLVESGWVARAERAGAEGLAQAANALAAVRHVGELADEGGLGMARAAHEFSHWLSTTKEGPASLSGGTAGAVQVMTVHASKGLEFPLVAVAECWGSSHEPGVSGVTCENRAGEVLAALVPPGVRAAELAGEQTPEPPAGADVLAWARHLVAASRAGDAAERARLLYVALTRARESLIVGLGVAEGSRGDLSPQLAGEMVATLLGGAMPDPGEVPLEYGGSAPARLRHLRLSPAAEPGAVVASPPELASLVAPAPQRAAQAAEGAVTSGPLSAGTGGDVPGSPDCFELFDERPEDGLAASVRQAATFPAREGVYSYSSVHAALRADQRPEAPVTLLAPGDDPADPDQTSDADKATSLGSAFHQLAQSMVEAAADHDPARLDAQARQWRLSARQRARLERAIVRWERSAIRREALAHELVRAEVPFFMATPGSAHGSHVEGAIDLLCCDAASRDALVIDYKTGDLGLSQDEIRERHNMQASFYAAVLLRQGFERVTCAFVCVELDDPASPGEPVVVRYAFDSATPPKLP